MCKQINKQIKHVVGEKRNKRKGNWTKNMDHVIVPVMIIIIRLAK